MRIHRLTAEDHELLGAAVRRFRGVEVRDHAPFLEDPATISFLAVADGEVLGWAKGTGRCGCAPTRTTRPRRRFTKVPADNLHLTTTPATGGSCGR
ncbi:MAG: hypothetical protein QOF58_367 [Pseudonocardiales bacterium]|jgi:hypothetical protein|nr:hypothetical protein [Pseudonocardiales bacterium]